jgi:predicted GNAT family N-acyltransferase
MELRVIEFQSIDYYQALALRDRVLRAPLGLFFSGEDIRAEHPYTHFGLFEESLLLATAQLVSSENGVYKMRQVAVNPDSQNQGLGSKLVHYLEQWVLAQNGNQLVLHARTTAVPFYLKLEYQCEGLEFMEVGIPHFRMHKRLS